MNFSGRSGYGVERMVRKIHHVGIVVESIAHAYGFWRDTLGLAEGSLPVAEDAFRRAITLPLFARMTDHDVDDVLAAVTRIVAAFRR